MEQMNKRRKISKVTGNNIDDITNGVDGKDITVGVLNKDTKNDSNIKKVRFGKDIVNSDKKSDIEDDSKDGSINTGVVVGLFKDFTEGVMKNMEKLIQNNNQTPTVCN